MWQISNVWVGHLQNIIHEEIESTINSKNIWYVRTQCHPDFLFAASDVTVIVLPVILYVRAVCFFSREGKKLENKRQIQTRQKDTNIESKMEENEYARSSRSLLVLKFPGYVQNITFP
jgi:hypothetical protein